MRFGLEPRYPTRIGWASMLIALAAGCDRDARTAPSTAPPSALAPREAEPPPAPTTDAPPASERADAGAAPADGAAQPHFGPYFTVTASSTGIYAEPSPDRSRKLGYARNGGRVPILPDIVEGEGCSTGWYRLLDGGYICSADGSTDSEDPLVRFAVRPPDLEAVLPYPYARNARNGTPLYSSVPTQEQIAAYEHHPEPADPGSSALQASSSLAWWQRKDVALANVRLAQLADESDGVLSRRMVKGFYVAVDTEFEWSSRSWYKTTKGLVAPKERFVAVEGSSFQGVELDVERSLPVAWVYGPRDERPKYTRRDDGKFESAGVIARLLPIHLVGEPVTAGGHEYVQASDGFWVRADHVRIAHMPPIPVDVESNEHWIHVDLPSQTLVALSGSTPVYATLVSSGRESRDADKDHRTPSGQWNIREKHVTTTMDGDGTAAGDLPYSIEDVPYVMYFQGSYALHAAFWHRNYGTRMSHGCINLAPLDAKYLFFFTGPTVREGWHGAWAGNGQTGSRIVIDGPAREDER